MDVARHAGYLSAHRSRSDPSKWPASWRKGPKNVLPWLAEHWYQVYVKDHPGEFAFDRLDGPFDTGADFVGIRGKRGYTAEVEKDYMSYLYHGHPRFDVLIVGVTEPPPLGMKNRLPRLIKYLDPHKVDAYTKDMRAEEDERLRREAERLPSWRDLQEFGVRIRGVGDSKASLIRDLEGPVELMRVKEGWVALAAVRVCPECGGTMSQVPYVADVDGDLTEGQEADLTAGFWAVFQCVACKARGWFERG
ncbi:MAG: hypothetical protein HY678_06310 [Chloroflexi bacterium]|nr:hypothetical protein [Chloroflexota bacterium]